MSASGNLGRCLIGHDTERALVGGGNRRESAGSVRVVVEVEQPGFVAEHPGGGRAVEPLPHPAVREGPHHHHPGILVLGRGAQGVRLVTGRRRHRVGLGPDAVTRQEPSRLLGRGAAVSRSSATATTETEGPIPNPDSANDRSASTAAGPPS